MQKEEDVFEECVLWIIWAKNNFLHNNHYL